MSAPRLTGIGWDHPRCSCPLDEAARQWQAQGGGTVEWTYRSLAEFNSTGLEDLARIYDLLVVDHPMMAHDASALRRLDALPSVQQARTNSIGASGTVYDWDGATYGVSIDVSTHVSAARSDLLDNLGESRPNDWEAVLALAQRHPGQVIASLSGDDALCTLLSITASMGQPISAELEPSIEAVALLLRLVEHCPSSSITLRPPAVLDLLAAGDAAYAPALFGYATYLRTPGSAIVYGPVPAHTSGTASGVMGGAGLAVSAFTQAGEQADRFVEWITGPTVQRDVLVPAGGQPGALAVWDDPTADAALGGFLTQTRSATEQAHVRLRHPAWPEFQQRAAGLLAAALPQRWSAEVLQAALGDLHSDTIRDH
jgi:multiple sugar transport system substrate-binding protein